MLISSIVLTESRYKPVGVFKKLRNAGLKIWAIIYLFIYSIKNVSIWNHHFNAEVVENSNTPER